MTNLIEAAGNELYARQSCRELAALFGVDAVVAYVEHGCPTGWVAVDPDDLESAIHAYAEHAESEQAEPSEEGE